MTGRLGLFSVTRYCVKLCLTLCKY